ncbi:neurturin isoform X2 [Dasypus novemcinctus]|uniref:neurturin isoform X2 n=1 Tax=Dasypus novemcinctus TaxID=9361 RepID=UPI00265F8B04|nr:neurturin isoform X2 [Dasypus novemcinctus]
MATASGRGTLSPWVGQAHSEPPVGTGTPTPPPPQGDRCSLPIGSPGAHCLDSQVLQPWGPALSSGFPFRITSRLPPAQELGALSLQFHHQRCLPAPPRSDRALLQGAPDAVELRELTPWAGRPPGPRRRTGPRRRRARARSGARPCGLRELEVRVSELGLGYASDETVLFRYCAGACEAAARVYDLGLLRLRQRRRVRRERVRARPCCRPTAYEDEVSFLDAHSRYHTVRELSARECACV